MKRNRKQNIRLLALILILLLGIGFAALTANLKIDGTVNVSRTSWDVHFENVNITEGSVTANPAPTSDDATTTEMTYTINFTKPGDYFEFTTDIVNEGTIDAMVESFSNNAYADSTSLTPIALPNYLNSYVLYEDYTNVSNNDLLKQGTQEKIIIRIEFKKNIEITDLPNNGDTTIIFKLKSNYKQADETAVDRLLLKPFVDGYWKPKYFEFGNPTTSSSTTKRPKQSIVFAALDDEGNKGVCIVKDDHTHCFKSGTDNVTNEISHIQEVFTGTTCSTRTNQGLPGISCSDDYLNTSMGVDGTIEAGYQRFYDWCRVSNDNSTFCNKVLQ